MNSSKTILKTTVLFAALRMISIFVNIGTSKFIAYFLGVAGVGFYGIINNTLSLITSIADLGVSKSSIRNISEARGEGNIEEISATVTVVKKLLFFTGLAGGVITIAASYYISIWSFNDSKYWFSFILLGVAVFFTILNVGRTSIFQGLREFKLITLNTSLSAIFGFIVSLLLLYFFKFDGIIYSVLSTAIIGFIISSYLIEKVKFINLENIRSHFKTKSVSIIKLGLAMMAVSFLVSLSGYLIRIFISKSGGLEDVGYFQAGFQIISGYFGIIFTSMVADYFPRLSAINNDNIKVQEEVNQQGVITLLLIGPLVTILPFIMPWLISILYTTQFHLTVDYVNIALFGIIFQSGSQTMGMVMLAKNESKIFIFSVTTFQTIFLILNVLGYRYYGIHGLGITFSLNMLIHFLGVQLLNKKFYNIVYTIKYYKIFLFTITLASIAFLSKDLENIFKWSLFIISLLCSLSFSVYHFKKLLKIKSVIGYVKNKLNAKNKKDN